MKIINPATEELITEIAEDSKDSLVKKLNTLKAAQPGWANVSAPERRAILEKFFRITQRRD